MKSRLFVLSTAALVLSAQLALASEETHGHGGHHGIPWNSLLFSTINLAIFIWVLARFVMPAVRQFVRDRRDRVVNDLADAATAKAAADRKSTRLNSSHIQKSRMPSSA